MTRTLRVRVALVLAIAVLAWQVTSIVRQGVLPPNDFTVYWAASRLAINGGNPYDAAQLLRVEQAVGWPEPEPGMMWNPPWTLAIIMPFGLLRYPVGCLLWVAMMMGGLTACIVWLWTYYGGLSGRRWQAILIGFTFAPVLIALKLVQISPLMVVGVVVFLYFAERGDWLAAGFAAGALLVKPQVVYLFWLALGLWAFRERRWSVLLGAGAALALAMAVVLLLDPAIIPQYLQVATSRGVEDWMRHTPGALLRMLFGHGTLGSFWLQFIPMLVGIGWFIPYWRRQSMQWDWGRQMPMLLLISVTTSPYAWIFDQVVFLPALLQAAIWVLYVRQRGLAVAISLCYLGIDILLLLSAFVAADRLPAYVGFMLSGPFALVGYLLLRRLVGDQITLHEGRHHDATVQHK